MSIPPRSATPAAAPAATVTAVTDDDTATDTATEADEAVTAELLVEEISIDGMCGVY